MGFMIANSELSTIIKKMPPRRLSGLHEMCLSQNLACYQSTDLVYSTENRDAIDLSRETKNRIESAFLK